MCYLRWLLLAHSYLAIKGNANADGYVGCYMRTTYMLESVIDNNNGQVCKWHCFPQYRYAGTRVDSCFCGHILPDNTTEESECSFLCPGQPYNRTCGGVFSITMYDIREMISPTREQTPMTTQFNVTEDVNNVTVSETMYSTNWATTEYQIEYLATESHSRLVVISYFALGFLILLNVGFVAYKCVYKQRYKRARQRKIGKQKINSVHAEGHYNLTSGKAGQSRCVMHTNPISFNSSDCVYIKLPMKQDRKCVIKHWHDNVSYLNFRTISLDTLSFFS